jgi:hypothetical protein
MPPDLRDIFTLALSRVGQFPVRAQPNPRVKARIQLVSLVTGADSGSNDLAGQNRRGRLTHAQCGHLYRDKRTWVAVRQTDWLTGGFW